MTLKTIAFIIVIVYFIVSFVLMFKHYHKLKKSILEEIGKAKTKKECEIIIREKLS